MRSYRGTAAKPPAGSRGVQGYTLRGKNSRVDYIGVTNNPSRRAGEHKRDGKRGSMRVETLSMSRASARRWESAKLATYRQNHGGKNPRHNQTRSGGWNG